MPDTHPHRQPPAARALHFARAPDALPPLHAVDAPALRCAAAAFAHLQASVLANPHHEPQVEPALHAHARSAAVLIPFVPARDGRLVLLLTERQRGLRFAGHLAFPGGHTDTADASAVATALRESEEEIGLARAHVDVLGTLPPYYSHAGHRIVGVLALVAQDAPIVPDEREVARLLRVPVDALFTPAHYRLHRRSEQPYRANFLWQADIDGEALRLGGPTLSLLIHVYDTLARTAQDTLARTAQDTPAPTARDTLAPTTQDAPARSGQ